MAGEMLYIYDEALRVYVDDDGTLSTNGPIYRKAFRRYVITGETRQSWLYERGGKTKRVRKDSALVGAEAWERHVWVHVWVVENKGKLAERVRTCQDYDKLRQIAAILDA